MTRFAHEHGGQTIGYYELDPLPGNKQIVVSNHAVILPEHRGQGYGTLMAAERRIKAKQLGYNYMICTVRGDNQAQLRIVEKIGWNALDSFLSSYTEQRVHIFGKELV